MIYISNCICLVDLSVIADMMCLEDAQQQIDLKTRLAIRNGTLVLTPPRQCQSTQVTSKTLKTLILS